MHPCFLLRMCKFTPFVDVTNSPDVDSPDLIDIIEAFNPRNGVKKPTALKGSLKWNSFYIRDLEDMRLHCTLWDQYADQFTNYLSTLREDPMFVLLQLGLINKRLNDSKGIVTSFHVSRFLFDEHTLETEEFHIGIMNMEGSGSQPSHQYSFSSRISNDDGREVGFTRTIQNYPQLKRFVGICFTARSHLYCLGVVGPTWVVMIPLAIRRPSRTAESTSAKNVTDTQWLIRKAAKEFTNQLHPDKSAPKAYPDDILKLIGRKLLFKIDQTLLSPSSGGNVYSINMISKNRSRIEQLAAVGGYESEGYNSDSDLEFFFGQLNVLESNLPSDFPDNDDLQTPSETPSKRPIENDLFSPSATGSTLSSTNKKMKGNKIEKP